MTALIRSSSLVGYQDLVAELGGDPARILKRFKIDPAVLYPEDNTIPFRSFIKLIETTASILDCPNFGLLLAQKQGFLLLGPVALIGLNSPTVGDALLSMLKHLDFHCPAAFSEIDTKTDPSKPRVTFDIAMSGENFGRQVIELGIGNVYQELLIMTQGTFIPQAILFRHSSPVAAAIYKRYFHTNVYFEQDVNAVVLSQKDMNWRLDKANPELKKLVADYVRQASTCRRLDIAAQVQFIVRRLLPTGNCGIKQVAQNLCVHERTLQRQLKLNNIFFEDIVDSVRVERAKEFLSNSQLSMAEIATSLGYREQASLNRACIRWFGSTPMKVRRISNLRNYP